MGSMWINKYNHYYNLLTLEEKELYKNCYFSIINYRKSLEVSNFLEKNIEKVFKYLGLDHPELYFVDFCCVRIAAGIFRKELFFSYSYDINVVNSISIKIKEITDLIIQKARSFAGDYDRVKYLYDYIVCNIRYDFDSISRQRTDKVFYEAHSIAGPLLSKKAVCEGIAKLFKFLCDKLDIEAICVVGKDKKNVSETLHEWNIVKIDGKYCQVDATGDIQVYRDNQKLLYMYFNLTDEEFFYDHYWNTAETPSCSTSSYSFYHRSNFEIRNLYEITEAIQRQIRLGKRELLLKVISDINDNQVNEEIKKAFLLIILYYKVIRTQ